MKIKSLGYVGIGAPDPLVWLDYATEVIGTMPARNIPGVPWGMPQKDKVDTSRPGVAADGSIYLKMDERQWRIAVHPDEENRGLKYFGLEVDDQLALEQAVAELNEQGIDARMGTAQQAYGRAVTGIAYLRDPAGNNLELFYGPTTDYNFASPVAGLEFVAGHLGLGHLNLFVSNRQECFDFYTRVLGFKLTDYIRFGPEVELQFLRCNARHHSIAMVDLGGIDGVQHMMLEVKTIDDVGKALDRAKARGIQITSELGRHRNDRALSFYMRSPFGFDVEIGCDCVLIDETWSTNEFCEGDVWGHEGLAQAVMESGEILREKKSRKATA